MTPLQQRAAASRAKREFTIAVKESDQPQIHICNIDKAKELEQLQKLVGGNIEHVYIAGPNIVMICNEDGLSRDLPPNCGFVGTLLFARQQLGKDGVYYYRSLTDEDVRKISKWVELHKDDMSAETAGGFAILSDEDEIKKHYEEQAKKHAAQLAAWDAL